MSHIDSSGHDSVLVGQHSQTRFRVCLNADVASVVRRIERFLYRGLVKQHEAAQSIIDALPENGRFILTMDGTSWQLGKFKYYVLAVGICFNGISLPICFTFLPTTTSPVL